MNSHAEYNYPGWSLTERRNVYLEPGKRFMTRRHTALINREGMTLTNLPYVYAPAQRSAPNQQQEERQVPKPPRFPRSKSEPTKRTLRSRSQNFIRLGDIVMHRGHGGEVKFIGRLPHSPDIYFGLEFPIPVGNSDGSYQGYRIFQTRRNYAGFYKAMDCMYMGESAAEYLPSGFHMDGKPVVPQPTASRHSQIQRVANSNDEFFSRELHRLTQQFKHSEKILNGRGGYVVNPKLNVVNSFKPSPRYPNYLPELKAERKRNEPPISVVIAPYAYDMRSKPSAPVPVQNSNGRQHPAKSNLVKYHNKNNAKPKFKSANDRHSAYDIENEEMRRIVNLYRASQKNTQAHAQGVKYIANQAEPESQPDSSTDMDATFAQQKKLIKGLRSYQSPYDSGIVLQSNNKQQKQRAGGGIMPLPKYGMH